MDFSKTKIDKLITHQVGNKLRDEKVFLSNNLQYFDDNLENTLLNYFLKSFLHENDFFHFTHSSNLKFNEMYSYSKDIFDSNSTELFMSYSQNIANHLYEVSLHPKVSRGELIIVHFKNIKFDENIVEAIGIFKAEKKDTFLKVLQNMDDIKLQEDSGINISKIEKGCLIFNTQSEFGFKILNIDIHQKITEYWSNKFLNIELIKNDSYKTRQFINLCKDFSDEVISKKYNKDEEFEFTNNFIDYFESNETFNTNDFIDDIFEDENMKSEFMEYSQTKEDFIDFNVNDNFIISNYDVKKEKRKIKNVIKLDTNMEVKFLVDKESDTKNIEKGFDESKGMYYYKIYFNKEIE